VEQIIDQSIPGGKYIIAVSGGVDSVVLLDVMSKNKKFKLIVAHFNHGIREDSDKDQKLVAELSQKYKLGYETDRVNLGKSVSEDQARIERYKFLFKIMEANQADGIILAHHKDDATETAIFNLLRGTGRTGITALDNRDKIFRPFLSINKTQIIDYANQNNLIWREDITNADTTYSRNFIRHKLQPEHHRSNVRELEKHIDKFRVTNRQIDQELENLYLKISVDNMIRRQDFINLPHKLSLEMMAYWLRKNGITNFDKRLIINLVIAAKTLKISKKISINKTAFLMIETKFLALEPAEC
jgi:tRNA(Ile)-lysidine synthase